MSITGIVVALECGAQVWFCLTWQRLTFVKLSLVGFLMGFVMESNFFGGGCPKRDQSFKMSKYVLPMVVLVLRYTQEKVLLNFKKNGFWEKAQKKVLWILLHIWMDLSELYNFVCKSLAGRNTTGIDWSQKYILAGICWRTQPINCSATSARKFKIIEVRQSLQSAKPMAFTEVDEKDIN